MNNLKHCTELAYTPGTSLYYAFMFETQTIKDDIAPIIAFAKTIYHISMDYREADIAKTKLQWWQQEIHALYQQNPTHPISHALLPVLKKYQIPQQFFLEYLDAAILKIDTNHFCTQQDIALFAYREQGLMLTAICYVLSNEPMALQKRIQHFAYSLTLIDLIAYARKYHLHGMQIFPLDAEGDEKALFQSYTDMAYANFEKAIADLSQKDKKSLRPIILYNKLQLKLLNEIKKTGFDVSQHEYHLTPLRKLLIIWWNKYTTC